ncbi:MAG TPA: 1-phosphofructokinase family hexose kinase [Pyrinomonadaceae bacterium]|jgi:1-phosphofructokinase family hexose kinase
MLICVSPNPAIDRRLRLESIAVGGVNRALSAQPFPGGKAAHVAMAARALGEEVMWIGFLGGAAGEECESGLSDLGIPVTIVRTRAETRANLELIADDGTVTEILEPGGEVTEGEVERLMGACAEIFAEGGAGAQVALSGSLPPGVPVDFYAELIHLAHAYGCRALLDTSGPALRHGLAAAPDLVKPNREEAAWFSGLPVRDAGAAAEVAQRMLEAGARSVCVSLGADGMVWQDRETCAPLVSQPPQVAGRSTVGCGDAALAGFAVAHARGLCDEEMVGLAVACGSANCLAPAPGLIDPREVERIARQVSVQPLQSACRSGR